jgi:hypothetical protein
MMRITLVTVSIIAEGCFSVLLDQQGVPYATTVERTFEDLRPVIPNGIYLCKKRMFNRGGYWTHEITGVEGHSLLLFHKGAIEDHSLGCIVTGDGFGWYEGKPAVLYTKTGFADHMNIVGKEDEFELEVKGR